MQTNSSFHDCMLNQWTSTPPECDPPSSKSFPFLQRPTIQRKTTLDVHAAWESLGYSSSLKTLLFLISSLTLWIYWRRRRIRRPKVLPVDTVHALSAVFTPTSSAWPSKFAYYFESASISRKHPGARGDELGLEQAGGCIEVDLSALIGHILAGNMELRDPGDLGPMFQGSLRMYAWSIRLKVGWEWKLEVARWLAMQHVFFADRLPLKDIVPPIAETPHCIDLDFIAIHNLEAYIRGICNRGPSSTSVKVEFSSIRPEVRLMSPEFFLCAIALVPKWKVGTSHSLARGMSLKTSTPLFVRLQDVIARIASAKSFTITNITNVSVQREASLLSRECDLVEEKDVRTCAVREMGTIGWREERLRLVWEAGLIRAGILQRWSIQLSKR